MTGSGCEAAATRSRSPIVSRLRRKLPATSSSSIARQLRRCSSSAVVMIAASEYRIRLPEPGSLRAMVSRIFSSILGPNPLMLCSLPDLA